MERVLPLGERELSKDTDKKDESHDFVSFHPPPARGGPCCDGPRCRGPCYRCSRSCGRYQRQPRRHRGTGYSFQTLDNESDPTFNQLLSINDAGAIGGLLRERLAGQDRPNRGYVLDGPYGQQNYVNENFPGAQQTQVTGINDSGTTVGFYADAAGDNFGFVLKQGIWTAVINPNTTGTVNQLLGLNNKGVAVG